MNNKNSIVAKKTAWAVVLFYMLVGFEFLYMAGPFAVYFYSAYNPVLHFFNDSPTLGFLSSYFLPHAVPHTSSLLISVIQKVGICLSIGGFALFCIGAFQVYYSKLAKKGAVLGGMYKLVRHPQYISFITCSFGLMLIWPRFIVMLMFITLLFAYYFLARIEEKECIAKFGKSYVDFMQKTPMFLPIKIKLPNVNLTKWQKIRIALAVYIILLTAGFLTASALQDKTLNSFYAIYESKSATISLSEMNDEAITEIKNIVFADPQVKNVIKNSNTFINYIMPESWYVPEIPMNSHEGAKHDHPADYDKTKYKVIITEAKLRTPAEGKEILTNTMFRNPLLEVHINLVDKSVKVFEIPEQIKYKNIPVAIY